MMPLDRLREEPGTADVVEVLKGAQGLLVFPRELKSPCLWLRVP